jgi:methionyl-tRNA formyltransferase
VKIVFAGTTTHAAAVLNHLHKTQHTVVAVLTREDAPVGRKAIVTPSAVAHLAQELDLPIIKANRITDEVVSQLGDFEPELGVVIAYGSLLKANALDVPLHGWINLHFSLLPKWRGAAPVQHSLLAGDQITGVTIFRLDEGMDTGPLLAAVPTEIQPDENAGELLNRLTQIGISALDESLARIAAGIAVFEQQTGAATFAGKLQRGDAKIDWSSKAENINNLVRAMNPEPIAWTTHGDSTMRVLSSRPTQLYSELPPGTVFMDKNQSYVTCGSQSVLQLLQVQPAGRNVMSATDWLRGQNDSVILGG